MNLSQDLGKVHSDSAVRKSSYIHSTSFQLTAEHNSQFVSESDAGYADFKKLCQDYDAVEELDAVEEPDVVKESDTKWINWRVWAIAGSGLFLASYNLVAINAIFPSIAFSYWKSDILGDYGTSMDTITLLGTAIGSLVCGYLSDKYGFRALYGLDVPLMLLGTWSLILSFNEKRFPTSTMLWVVYSRLNLGIGVGSQYPLSVAITTE
jgi:hypothetical protein